MREVVSVKSWYNSAKRFLYEVWLEAKPGGRVNWPGPKKLMESTLLVFVCTLIFMIYIGGIDLIFELLISSLTDMFRG